MQKTAALLVLACVAFASVLSALTIELPAQCLIADLNGNGIDLSKKVRTTLLTDAPLTTRWVNENDEDRFLAVDATALSRVGFQMTNAVDFPIDGVVLARPGVRVRKPDGEAATIASIRDLLQKLDTNRDGKLNRSDPTWASLRWFADTNADGAIGPGELATSAAIKIQSIAIAATDGASFDSHGTSRLPSSGTFANGATFRTIDANPATD